MPRTSAPLLAQAPQGGRESFSDRSPRCVPFSCCDREDGEPWKQAACEGIQLLTRSTEQGTEADGETGGGGGRRAVPSHSWGRQCPKGSCREVDSRLKIWKHQRRLKWFSLCSATFRFGEGPGTSPWRSGLSPPPVPGMEVGRKHSASQAVLGPCPALNRVPGKQRHRPPAPSTSHPCVPRITLFPSRGLVRTPELCSLHAGSLCIAMCPLRADPSARLGWGWSQSRLCLLDGS